MAKLKSFLCHVILFIACCIVGPPYYAVMILAIVVALIFHLPLKWLSRTKP